MAQNLPIVVIVGRPNVGKSTLFNRLTRSHRALVDSFSGVTRDCLEGHCVSENQMFKIIDTGGLCGIQDEFYDVVRSRVWTAVSSADLILFVVDARSGLQVADSEFSVDLRRHALGAEIMVVANKSEGIPDSVALSEFFSLGFDAMISVSAVRGDSINKLLKKITTIASKNVSAEIHDQKIKLAFIGCPNVGKSTIVNRVLKNRRMIVSEKSGTTRDSVHIDFSCEHGDFTLIDTAGIRARTKIDQAIEELSAAKAIESLGNADVVILIVDASKGVTRQDKRIANLIEKSGRAVLLLANKKDLLNPADRRLIKRKVRRELPFMDYAEIFAVSAHSPKFSVSALLKSVCNSYKFASCQLSTPEITRKLRSIVARHPPPKVSGIRPKLRYAHQGGSHPPLIIIHGSALDRVEDDYCRYLARSFSAELGITGVPVKLLFRNSVSPYANN